MKLATRLYLAVVVVLSSGYVVAIVTVRPDAQAALVLSAALVSALLVLGSAIRLMTRGLDRRLKEAEGALDRIASGELDIGVGSDGRDSVSRLGRTIDRMAGQLRERAESIDRASEDLRELFDGLDDGLAYIDETGLIGFCNPAFERWAGRSIPEYLRIGSVFRNPAISRGVDAASRGHRVIEEIPLGDSTVLMSARPHGHGVALVLQDLTAIRRLEDVRRDFVANVSHELKTPLTSVVGFAEALSDGPLPPERSQEFVDRILANATRMRRLVDDLLDLSLLESGSWAPEAEVVAVGALAAEVWTALPADLRGRHRTIEIADQESQVLADIGAVRQILRNLLDNAARYADTDSPIEVRSMTEGDFLRVEVIDHGPGVASHHLERVFERFYRVDPARSRERGGTGLGLAIVKHYVEAHGGEVGVESALGEGTTVWFTLPSSDPHQPIP